MAAIPARTSCCPRARRHDDWFILVLAKFRQLAHDQYLLTAGRFVIRGGIDHNGKMVDQLPAITIARDGRVSRQMLPVALKTALDRQAMGGGDGSTRPTAAGLLVIYGSWPAQGGGLYVSQAGAAKRVWCVPSTHNSDACSLEQLEISPDGCLIAFVAKNDHPKTVKIIRLCSFAREK